VKNWSKNVPKRCVISPIPLGNDLARPNCGEKKTLPGLKCHVYFWGHLGNFKLLQTNESSNQRSRHSSISVVKHETIRYPLTGASITCCFTSNNH